MMDLNKAYILILGKLSRWMREFVRLLPNIVLAALILVLGFFLARLLRRLAARVIGRFSHLQMLNHLFSTFVYIVGIGITLFIALSVLKLDKAVTSILAGAGIAGIALAFAFQDIAANFMSGILLTFRRPLRIGDIVKCKDYFGKVEDINLRDTVMRTFQGQLVIIPNKDILQNPIENYTLSGKRRMDLTIGVSYGEDLEKVKQVALAAAEKVSVRCAADEITLFFTAFDESSINFDIRIWCDSPEQLIFLQAQSEAIMHIKKAFDEAGILIPYPIRTLDFGIKGGKELSEMVLQFVPEKNNGPVQETGSGSAA